MSDETRRFRLEWTTYQEHAETFTLAELRELARQGHDIFYDGEPDLDALEAMNDDGLFAAITTGDSYLRTTWAAMDRADEVDVYGRVLEYGRIPAAQRVTWRIIAGDRTAGLDAGPYAHAVAGTPGAAAEFLRRACELMRARRPHLASDGTPARFEASADLPELVLTAGPQAACVFTDPVHGAEASTLAAEIAWDEGRSGVRLDIDAAALASASPRLAGMPGEPTVTYQAGDRVALVHTSDPYTRLTPGTAGTVTRYDPDLGQLDMAWDDGSSLSMLLRDGDQVRLITPARAPAAGTRAAREDPAPAATQRCPAAGSTAPASLPPDHPGQ